MNILSTQGLSWPLAAFFMVTDMAIGGMVTLPGAICRIGLSRGLALLLLSGLFCCCSAILLGQCWLFVLDKSPQLRQKHCRRPYAEIGFCALGRWMSILVSVGVNVTQFGIATVFLLLCSVNLSRICSTLFHADLSQCLLLLILALLLLPLTLLKSPNEFWPILFGGMICTVATFGIILFGISIDLLNVDKNATSPAAPPITLPQSNFNNYMNAIGTLLFAFGGHPVFPSIQHDMKVPADFHKSAIFGFSVITLFNFLVVLSSSFAYGDTLSDSVVGSIRTAWVQQAALALITANSLLGITLVINPLNQEAEELFGTPQEFGIARLCVRSAVLASVLFVAQSVPNFGPFLGFVGSSTVPLVALILPFLFHFVLSNFSHETNEQTQSKFILWTKGILYGTVITFALIIGICASLSSLKALFGAHFKMPCYLQQKRFNESD
ncbi:hypothetical protein niasHT_025314 [Heterodera trifolii]|uniref:Amino acid transporter transmembrane domain-containing protein n=1 Tax=Heterodera trifolii TaxID=157864 RepID=A0ABD2KKH7_9BILA